MPEENQYHLSIQEQDGREMIFFANNTDDFVEVVVTVNGKETKKGQELSEKTRGYAYTPGLRKFIKKRDDGTPIEINSETDEIVAYIFSGKGKYKDEDLDKPTLFRNKLVDSVKFKRNSNEPVQVIKIKNGEYSYS